MLSRRIGSRRKSPAASPGRATRPALWVMLCHRFVCPPHMAARYARYAVDYYVFPPVVVLLAWPNLVSPFRTQPPSHGLFPVSILFRLRRAGVPGPFSHLHLPASMGSSLHRPELDTRPWAAEGLDNGPPYGPDRQALGHHTDDEPAFFFSLARLAAGKRRE